MSYLPAVMIWVWACLVFTPRNPISTFFLLPVLLPVVTALELMRTSVKRTVGTLKAFVGWCVDIERGDK